MGSHAGFTMLHESALRGIRLWGIDAARCLSKTPGRFQQSQRLALRLTQAFHCELQRTFKVPETQEATRQVMVGMTLTADPLPGPPK